jgi:ABC-2 type transport system ATP-binding protein
VRELHAAGQTILLTTHYMEEADQLCDRVAIMDRGTLLALDTPSRLKSTLGADTEIRIQSTGDLHVLAERVATLPGVAGARPVDGTVHVFVRRGGPALPEIITHADHAGFHISDVGTTEATLETVFIELTGKDLRE